MSDNFEAGLFNKIFREDTTIYIEHSARRIDITIDFGNLAIGIENKPWATEQSSQLEDYKNHLRKKYGSNFILFYLTGDGHKPQTLKEASSKVKMLSYNLHIMKWLTECYRKSKADKIRWFLLDFITYIEQTFPLTSEENK